MPKKQRSIRRQAFNEDQYPEVTGTRCVEIRIPDSIEFLYQLQGLLSIPAQQFQYTNEDTAKAKIIAQQWRDANLETDWEGCMNCEEVADCIENSEEVQDALKNFLDQFNFDKGETGSPMPESERNRALALGFNPSCNPNIVWSQAVKLVERMEGYIVDLLESLSEASSVGSAVDILAQLPLLENLGVGSLTSLANFLTEVPLETFNDAYTTEYAEDLECEIFCTAKETCEISFENVWQIFVLRVEPGLPVLGDFPLTGTLIDWIGYISPYLSYFTSLNKADFMFYLLFGGLRFGNLIINQTIPGIKLFETALALAADEPSNDWITLCTDCECEFVFVPFYIFANVADHNDSTLNPLITMNTHNVAGDYHPSAPRWAFLDATYDIDVDLEGAVNVDSVKFTWFGGAETRNFTAQIDDGEEVAFDLHYGGFGIPSVAIATFTSIQQGSVLKIRGDNYVNIRLIEVSECAG